MENKQLNIKKVPTFLLTLKTLCFKYIKEYLNLLHIPSRKIPVGPLSSRNVS